MRKRQSHWPALTYYHPCFDFSESIRTNPCNVINIHEPNSSFILSAFYIVISGIIRSSFVILSIISPFFIETLNDKQYLKGIVHFEIKIWYLSAYPKGIQDIGVFFFLSRSNFDVFRSNRSSLSVI